jgi:hypothetical protein
MGQSTGSESHMDGSLVAARREGSTAASGREC